MPGDPQPLSSIDMAGMAKAWSATAGNLTYRIGYQELSLDDSSPDQTALDQRFDTYIETLPEREDVASREGRKPTSVARMSGAEFVVTTPDKKARRGQLCIAGGRMYRIDVTGPSEAVAGADADVFFNSLKISR
jgi:hypothetical protein